MVKRWFAALAAGFAVCLGGMACAAEEPPAPIQFFDGAGGQLRFLTEGAVTVRAALPEEAGEAVLVTAVMRGDTLVSAACTRAENGAAQAELTPPDGAAQDEYVMRAFLWDAELRPLTPVYELQPPPKSAAAAHPNSGKYFSYLFASWDRGRLSESQETLTAAVQSYLNMDEAAFVEYARGEAAKATHLNSRPNVEILAQRMCLLYRKTGNSLAARRAAIAMYQMAAHYPSVSKTISGSSFNAYGSCLPVSCVYGYDSIYGADEVWQQLFDETGDNYQAVIEQWFRSALDDYHTYYDGMFFGNVTPYGIKNAVGTAIVLNDPDRIRQYLAWADRLMTGAFYHSDGMWGEGTVDYHTVTYNNIGELINLLSTCYTDPPDYPGERIDYQNLRSRWPMLTEAGKIPNLLKFPDGRKIAVNDTGFEDPDTKRADDPILASHLGNIELNHFGFYALTRGDTSDAAQISLSMNPQAEGLPYSGGHYHANQLGITLWGGGIEVLPDAGYPYERRSNGMFHMSAPAHNTVWVWDAAAAQSYGERAGQSTRAALLAYDDGTASGGAVMLAEGSQPGPEGDNVQIKRRLLLSVQIEGSRSYFVDISRLKGGQAHELYLRAAEEEDCDLQTSLLLDRQEGTLAEYLKGTGRTEGLNLYRNLMRTPSVGDGAQDFWYTWTGQNSGTTVKAFMSGVPDGEVYFSRIPTLRRTQNKTELQDAYPGWHLYRRRLVDAEDITRYGAVYETYRQAQQGLVQSVRFTDAEPHDEMAGAAVVTSGKYVDTVYYSNDTARRTVNGITFSGRAAVLRTDRAGNPVWGYVYGQGGIWTANGAELTGVPDQERTVTGAKANTITVDRPLDETPAGQWMTTVFGDGSGYGLKISGADGAVIATEQPAPFALEDGGARMLYFPSTEKGTYQPRSIGGGITAALKIPSFKQF